MVPFSKPSYWYLVHESIIGQLSIIDFERFPHMYLILVFTYGDSSSGLIWALHSITSMRKRLYAQVLICRKHLYAASAYMRKRLYAQALICASTYTRKRLRI